VVAKVHHLIHLSSNKTKEEEEARYFSNEMKKLQKKKAKIKSYWM